MVLICFLFEVFECIQSFWALLYLIKNNQCFLWFDFLITNHREQFYNTERIFVCFKNGLQLIFFIKVKINKTVIIIPSELFHQPGFANLSCALKHHWFAFLAVFPLNQFRNYITFQQNHHPCQ